MLPIYTKPLHSDPSQTVGTQENKNTLAFAVKNEKSNPKVAFSVYAELAANGDAFAQYKCGVILMEGHPGVPQDVPKAREYLEMAEKNGSSEAKAELNKYGGSSDLTPSPLNDSIGNGISVDQRAFRAPQVLSLVQLMCRAEDLKKECDFRDYRTPNEGTPKNVQSHLALMEKGWIVSVGTERSFYDLLLSPEDKCDGLIIRDIHPKIKAYNDFLILLLWCADNREDFCNLSSNGLNIDYSRGLPWHDLLAAREAYQSLSFRENRIALLKPEIQARIGNVEMPSALRSYFLDNFEILADAYLWAPHKSAGGDNTGIEYQVHDDLFEKLQRYAKAGKIISTLGDINDLRFAAGREITIIDTSNVADYVPIAPTGYGRSTPRIIFTKQDPHLTTYYSSLHEKISPQEIDTIKEYLGFLFKDQDDFKAFQFYFNLENYFKSEKPSEIYSWVSENCLTKETVLSIKNALIKLTALMQKEQNPQNFLFMKKRFTENAWSALLNKANNKKPETKAGRDNEIILNKLLNAT